MNAAPRRADAAEACRTLLGTRGTTFATLARTPRSAVFRTVIIGRPGPVIVKLYAGSSAWRAVKERAAITATAATEAFVAPRVLGAGMLPRRQVGALILEDLGARTLQDAVVEGCCTRAEAVVRLGQLLAAFHRLPAPGSAGTASSAFAARALRLRGRLPPRLLSVAEPVLQRAVFLAERVPEVWCHGDLHLHNVLPPSSPPHGPPGVVDFEESDIAFADWDLAQTAVTTDSLTRTDLTRLLHGYGRPPGTLLPHLIVFQALRGWHYAQRDERDREMWRSRLETACAHFAPLTVPN